MRSDGYLTLNIKYQTSSNLPTFQPTWKHSAFNVIAQCPIQLGLSYMYVHTDQCFNLKCGYCFQHAKVKGLLSEI